MRAGFSDGLAYSLTLVRSQIVEKDGIKRDLHLRQVDRFGLTDEGADQGASATLA